MNDYNEDRQEFSVTWFVVCAVITLSFWTFVAFKAWVSV